MIEGVDSKVITVCLINDYSLIADRHIFDYGGAECATISLECTKVKLVLNHFVSAKINNSTLVAKKVCAKMFALYLSMPLIPRSAKYWHFSRP